MAIFKGTSVRDTIIGGDDADEIKALADQDVIDGGAGNDTLYGGSDNDTIIGGLGDDYIDDNSGHDSIEGNDGNDTIIAGSGDDTITGGVGDDSINAGSGQDTVDAGEGNDEINAGSGNDCVVHNVGDNQGFVDYMDGASGIDTLKICVTEEEALLYAAELQALADFIASGSQKWYTTTIGTNEIHVRRFENMEIVLKDGGDNFPIPPDAVNDEKIITEDTANASGNVLTNDTDANGDALTVSNPGVYAGAHGTLTLNADGTYDYAHDTAGDQYLDDGESVQDAFNVEITDGGNGDVSTLTITIDGVNDKPNSHQPNGTAAGDDENSLGEDDASVNGDVLANDTDPENDPLNVNNPGVYVGAHGTLTLNADGTYTYANDVDGNQYLDTGESVQDVFNVTVSDGDATDDTQLTITINGENDAPNSHQPNGTAAGDDLKIIDEDTANAVGNVLANDTDPESDPLSVNNPGVYVGAHGTLTLNADGSYDYAHDVAGSQSLDDGESFFDVFNVVVSDGDATDDTQLTLQIDGVNDAPNSHQPGGTAAGDDTNSLGEDDASVDGDVLANDTDPEGDALSVANPNVYIGVYGTLTLNADGTYSYANDVAGNQYLDTGESVNDVFSVTVSDGDATDTTFLTITINGENDAPNSHQPDGTAAGDDLDVIDEDTANTNGNVLTNDTDPEGDLLTVNNPGVYVGAHGTLTLNADGSYDYAHDTAGSQGLGAGDSFFDVFSVVVSDGDATDDTELTIRIDGINEAPVTEGETDSLTEDDFSTSGNVLTNDSDPDGDPIIAGNPGAFVGTYGTLNLNTNGNYSYDIDPVNFQYLDTGENLVDVFNYEVTDGFDTTVEQIEFTILGINDAPTAVDDVAVATVKPGVNTALFGNVLDNDSDPEQAANTLDVISFVKTSATNFGTFNFNADGSWTFLISVLPADGVTVIETWDYVVQDNGGLVDTGQLSFEITGDI